MRSIKRRRHVPRSHVRRAGLDPAGTSSHMDFQIGTAKRRA